MKDTTVLQAAVIVLEELYPSCKRSLKGTVRILNISAQNSGLYRCTVSNPHGTEACSVDLSVYSSYFYPRSLTASHGAAGILQAVSLTLCMALVLLALLALVLWFHRSGHDRKWREEGEEEECYNEIRTVWFCLYLKQCGILLVAWLVFLHIQKSKITVQVIVYDRGQVIESPSLIGRVSFRSVPLSADIVLNSTRLSDAGTYRCVVNNPPEPAPPSSPLCLWDGRADEGGSISLSCSVEEGVPVPELRWDKLEPDQISLPVNKEAHPVRVTVRETSVQVLRGDSVLLPCSFVTMATLSRLNIIWTVTPLSEPSSPSQVWVPPSVTTIQHLTHSFSISQYEDRLRERLCRLEDSFCVIG
ncbi:Immunoglobulin superfamily member 11 [Acipenser ruthenus]|nr:Immunoglobulin superfamily member 11 [Acipenser ruthenus]